MRILLTGDKGFVGSHIRAEVESVYNVVGLEARGSFQEWIEDMNAAMDTDIDAVIHAGAIADSQSQDPDIYLWNSYATFLLAQCVRQRSVPIPRSEDSDRVGGVYDMSPIPFIFFSSFLVSSTIDDWEARTPYSWSKAQAESFVRAHLPHATILRPSVIWGDEREKNSASGSVPFRLASHNLAYMFRHWARNYVHVHDIVAAVKLCLENRPKGTFDLITEYVTNAKISTLVKWQGYEWIDDPREVGFKYISSHNEDSTLPTPPGWTPKVLMEEELPRLERELSKT